MAKEAMVPTPPPLLCAQAPPGLDCCCCSRCFSAGCDLKVVPCGCCLHTRCCPVTEENLLQHCPVCGKESTHLCLIPMLFDEIDRAREEASRTNLSTKRGKKRQNATISRLNPQIKQEGGYEEPVGKTSPLDGGELRIGRWTVEETEYCDKLIKLFEGGLLPIPDGTKLNDFLSSMLKSKQARLTKKMKNARLSAREYKKTTGFIVDNQEARFFSRLEANFFASIKCNMERSEIRFHMQREWRELYSAFCLRIGQRLDGDRWLSTVEEMDRRSSIQKDAARIARRKERMGLALGQDKLNSQNGVFIDGDSAGSDSEEICRKKRRITTSPRPGKSAVSPFVNRVIEYAQFHRIPFEHADAWVPSFAPQSGGPLADSKQRSRLFFAGAATADAKVPTSGGPSVPLTDDEHFDFVSFGEYSQKFSFEEGCGLPGRVYSSGVASWEQGIQKAPKVSFERIGGASQWDINTVLCVPVPSPNVGRIVVVLYSKYDRLKDEKMVHRITQELTKLIPSPRWRLTVDIGSSPAQVSSEDERLSKQGQATGELLALIKVYTPEYKTSPLAPYLPGFTAIRLLLRKTTKSDRDYQLLNGTLKAYSDYRAQGRSDFDTAWMVARDFMSAAKKQNEIRPPTPNLQNMSPSENVGLVAVADPERKLAMTNSDRVAAATITAATCCLNPGSCGLTSKSTTKDCSNMQSLDSSCASERLDLCRNDEITSFSRRTPSMFPLPRDGNCTKEAASIIRPGRETQGHSGAAFAQPLPVSESTFPEQLMASPALQPIPTSEEIELLGIEVDLTKQDNDGLH